jgi:hypothetical protein
MSDALDELVRALAEQEHVEERLAKAAHALAEAEERLDDEASDVTVAEVEELRLRYAEALAAAEAARERRLEAEAQLDPSEVARAYGLLTGVGRG